MHIESAFPVRSRYSFEVVASFGSLNREEQNKLAWAIATSHHPGPSRFRSGALQELAEFVFSGFSVHLAETRHPTNRAHQKHWWTHLHVFTSARKSAPLLHLSCAVNPVFHCVISHRYFLSTAGTLRKRETERFRRNPQWNKYPDKWKLTWKNRSLIPLNNLGPFQRHSQTCFQM